MSSLGVIGELGESKFEWKIADFFSLSATKESSYTSPSFVFANTSLHLWIYPAGNVAAKSGFLSLFLVNESKNPFHVNMALHIKKVDGTILELTAAMDVYIKTSMGYNNLYQKSSLKQNKSELVPSNILTIVCILKLKRDGKQDTVKAEAVEDLQEKQSHKILDDKTLTGNV